MSLETILIVDDDQIMVELLAIWLEDSGYATVTALDASTALAAFKSVENVVAAICDFELGNGTGCQVIGAIHSVAPGLKTILISGHSEQRVRSECRASDVHFLQKPFDPGELVEIIKQP